MQRRNLARRDFLSTTGSLAMASVGYPSVARSKN